MEGLTTHNFDTFWEINQILSDRTLRDTKKFAFRIFSNRCSTYIQPHILAPASLKKHSQEEEELVDPEIGELLVGAFPALFEHEIGEDMETSI